MRILLFFIGLLTALWPNTFSYLCIFLLIVSIFIYFCFIHKKYYLSKTTILVLLIIIFGYFWGEINVYFHSQQKLPLTLENKAITVEGRIASVPNIIDNSAQFQFQIDTKNAWHGKVMLSWYNNFNHNQKLSATFAQLKPGQKWRFTIKLKRPRGYSNPGSFDYEAWLFEQNIMAKGYIIDKKAKNTSAAVGAFPLWAPANGQPKSQNILLEPPKWYYIIEQMRQHIAQQWEPLLEQSPLLGVLLALTIGLNSHITPEQWQVFTNTGTIHLISISGFHISLMAGIAFGLINFIWRRIAYLCERFPAQKAAAMAAIIVSIIYSLLAGFSIPTERSLIMVIVFMGSLVFQRQTNVWECFLVSLFAVILWDPFAPLNISFWLSFSAVAVILYAMMDPLIKPENTKSKKISHIKHALFQNLKLQLYIFLGLIPFSLFWFSQVSVSSLWANLIAIPVAGFFILPLALAAIIVSTIYFPLAVFLMKISHWFFAQLYLFLEWISHDHPVILFGTLDQVWMLLLGVFGMLLLLAPKGFPARWIGLIFWLPLLMPIKNPINYGEANISLLDVGQGLATVVQTKNHVLVFDTGPKLSENFDTGKSVVLPYLRNQHIHHIDTLVISHADLDHRGGMESVLKGISVKKLIVNDLNITKNLKAQSIATIDTRRITLCKPNMSWQWDGVTFEFLTQGLEQFTNTNDKSCVLKISNGKYSVLFPGDLEAQGERVLIKNYGKLLQSDLIIAGHHGSKTSSSLDWLNYVNPTYALFPTGYLNRYHFPNVDVVERYKKLGAKTLSTADCGLIWWKLPYSERIKDEKHLEASELTSSKTLLIKSPHCYRQDNSHPWY